MLKRIKLSLFLFFPLLLLGQKFELINSFQIDTFESAGFYDAGLDFVLLGNTQKGISTTSLIANIDGTFIRASHFGGVFPRQFSKNLRIKAKKKDKYGFVNSKGEIIIPLEYDDLGGRFVEGKILGKKNGQWFFIDTLNQVSPFPNIHNYELLEIVHPQIIVAKNRNGGSTLLNFKGELLLEKEYDSIVSNPYHDHLYIIRSGKMKGVISLKTGIIIPLNKNNLPIIRKKNIENGSRREYGINFSDIEGKPLDTKNKFVTLTAKGIGYIFQEIRDGKKFQGICDYDFNTVIPAEYKNCTILAHDYLKLTYYNDDTRFYNNDSSIVIKRSGELILPMHRARLHIFSPDDIITSTTKLVNGRQEKEITWFDGTGKTILAPFTGTLVSSNPFHRTLQHGQVHPILAVKQKDTTGVIKIHLYDRTAKLLNIIDRDSVFRYTPSLFLVIKNKKQGLINKEGKLVLPIEYKDIIPIRNRGKYEKIPPSFFKVITPDGRLGLADMDGNLVFLTDEKVHKISLVSEKYLWVIKGNEYQIYEWQK